MTLPRFFFQELASDDPPPLAASRSTKRSTHARPGMHMQQCSAVPKLPVWIMESIYVQAVKLHFPVRLLAVFCRPKPLAYILLYNRSLYLDVRIKLARCWHPDGQLGEGGWHKASVSDCLPFGGGGWTRWGGGLERGGGGYLSQRSVGRCGRCSCWCRFRIRGAQWLVCRGCAGCGGTCRLRVSGAQ